MIEHFKEKKVSFDPSYVYKDINKVPFNQGKV